MGHVVILRVSILNLQACSDLDDVEEITWEVNRLNLAGTTNGWGLDTRPEVAPVVCAEHPERKHYVFCC
jgi:hypothetical protein